MTTTGITSDIPIPDELAGNVFITNLNKIYNIKISKISRKRGTPRTAKIPENSGENEKNERRCHHV